MLKRNLLSTLLILSAVLAASAQHVSFEFSDGIGNGPLKAKMERQVSALLTAINKAAAQNTDINYSGIQIDTEASKSIGMTWRVVHFSTEDDDIVDHCIQQKTKTGRLRGYQIRNIGVTMIPLDGTYDGPTRREITIDLGPDGRIEDFNFAMGTTEYASLIREGERLDDLDRRMQIVHWCEQFQNAYNKCDLKFMEDVFSDDALIITGKMKIRRVPGDMAMKNPDKTEYIRQTKEQYLKGLERVFRNNHYINVKFSEYKINRHASKPNYYGVTLIQDWNTSSYSDKGIVFLVWDFTDEDQPKIHVRTWQPTDESAFTLGNFVLP